jgi:glycerol-3-phosphate acyltransferase PlsY
MSQMPALVMLIGYLLGSIPFGLILTRLAGAGDLRAIGSGSIGATNVLRTGRKGLAAATLFLDGAKGAVAVLIGAALLPDGGGALGGVMALIGHCYPVWLRFNGGKGVASLIGVALVLYWPTVVVFAVVWLTMARLTRISSMGGMSAAVAMPIAAYVLGRHDLVLPFAAMAALVLWKHRPNIRRLVAGTETRIGQK